MELPSKLWWLMINFEEDEAHFGKISSLLCPGLNGRKDKKKKW